MKALLDVDGFPSGLRAQYGVDARNPGGFLGYRREFEDTERLLNIFGDRGSRPKSHPPAFKESLNKQICCVDSASAEWLSKPIGTELQNSER